AKVDTMLSLVDASPARITSNLYQLIPCIFRHTLAPDLLGNVHSAEYGVSIRSPQTSEASGRRKRSQLDRPAFLATDVGLLIPLSSVEEMSQREKIIG